MKNFVECMTEAHLEKLRKQLLFSGLSEHEIFMFIQFANPKYLNLHSGKTIQIAREYSHMTAVIFSGRAYIYNVDYEGNKGLLKTINENENSGTLYAMFDYSNTLVEFTATEDTEILFISPENLFIADKNLAVIQHKILANLVASQREIFLEITEHISCLSRRSIRDKLIRFLKICCDKNHSYSFEIKYTREELANYLAVDRSALSRVMGELKSEGIIDFERNRFTVVDPKAFKAVPHNYDIRITKSDFLSG